MSARCRNCGRVITMSNINTSIFGISGVCSDCNKANTGINAGLLIHRLDKEDEEAKRKVWQDKSKREFDAMKLENKLLMEAREQARKDSINERYEIINAEQDRLGRLEIEKIYHNIMLKDKAKKHANFMQQKVREKETRELWVYLLKQGTISAFDDIELDETGATYTIIPMGKANKCTAALKYREENKIDVN